MAKTDRTTTKTNRAAFWQEHLSAWSASGLTQVAYCRRHQLSRAAFGWWKRQLRGKPSIRKGRTATKEPPRDRRTAVQFVEVQHDSHVDPGGGPAVYEVLLSRRRVIRVGPVFDPEVLKRLIATVEASC